MIGVSLSQLPHHSSGSAKALAHVVQNKVEAAYARSDLFERRRRLVDDWAAYLDGGPGPAASG